MMRVLLSYLYEKKNTLLLWIGIELIFVVSLILYRVEPEYYLYPLLLSSVLVFFCGAISFILYYRKHKARCRMLAEEGGSEELNLPEIDELPEPSNLTEREYLRLLQQALAAGRAAQTRGEGKTKEMQEYITLWAHQMKTPITAMDLTVQQMEAGERVSLQQQVFEMDRYVDTLLQYLRLDSMNHDLVLQQYSLEKIVREAIRYYSKTFILKHLSVETRDLDTYVTTDAKWLLFCLKQILSNALKYTKAGGIAIYAEHTERGVCLSIQDTGIGIAAEDIPRIFEKGFTGYNGHSDKKATGIGLYLTKKILDQLGHEIGVVSEVGVGTTISVYFTGQKGL